MRTLKQDGINLSRGVERAALPRVRFALPALMLVSLALMVLSRLEHSAIRAARAGLGEVLAPALSAAMAPVSVVRDFGHRLAAMATMADELDRLRAANSELQASAWRAQELERQLAELTRQTRTVTGPDPASLSTRVLAQSGGAFTRSLMIEAGREHGLKPGHPVVTVDGLAGRIVDAGRRTASVLLITDVNSRVPVTIAGRGSLAGAGSPAAGNGGGNSVGVRAVMVGDNGPQPRLTFLGEGVVRDGDAVATSGVGGLYPRGTRVGTVAMVGGVARVVPAVRLDDLIYVRVLLFDSDTLQFAGERAALAAPVGPQAAARDGSGAPAGVGPATGSLATGSLPPAGRAAVEARPATRAASSASADGGGNDATRDAAKDAAMERMR